MMIKVVILDVDGTLIDSNDFHAEAWQKAFLEFGKTVKFEDLRGQIGKGVDQLLPVFFGKEKAAEIEEEIGKRRGEIFKKEFLPRVKPFPKVREFVQKLKDEGYKVVFASSAEEKEVDEYAKIANVADIIDDKTSAEDAEKTKPAPDIFQTALKNASVKPSEAVVIGDTPFDAEAAKKAGVKCLGVLSGGFTLDELKTSGCAEIYRDVAEILEKFDQTPMSQKS